MGSMTTSERCSDGGALPIHRPGSLLRPDHDWRCPQMAGDLGNLRARKRVYRFRCARAGRERKSEREPYNEVWPHHSMRGEARFCFFSSFFLSARCAANQQQAHTLDAYVTHVPQKE